MVEIVRTIKIPIAMETTKKKKDIVNRISERITYGVQLYLERIVENDITKLSDANKFQKEIREITKLSSAFVECARDRALWSYRS